MIGRGKGDVKIYEGVREKYTDNIFGENDIGELKMRKNLFIFQNCDCNIGLFSIAKC